MGCLRGASTYVILCALCASLNSVLLGYDIGVMGGAMYLAQGELQLTEPQVELCLGILNVSAIIGAVIAGTISDRFGRTKTIAAASSLLVWSHLRRQSARGSRGFPALSTPGRRSNSSGQQ